MFFIKVLHRLLWGIYMEDVHVNITRPWLKKALKWCHVKRKLGDPTYDEYHLPKIAWDNLYSPQPKDWDE